MTPSMKFKKGTYYSRVNLIFSQFMSIKILNRYTIIIIKVDFKQHEFIHTTSIGYMNQRIVVTNSIYKIFSIYSYDFFFL